ncbi:MAG: amidohydrolase family protein [Phycisphaerae bacterium]|nr:amidohydrolase family protein [Phycisphaerae bacterium]
MPRTFPLPERIIDIHNHLGEGRDPAALIELMDKSNIEMTLIMGTFKQPNEDVLKAVGAHPDRLVGGAYVDPRNGDAIEQLKRHRGEGFRVVKLFPNFGYYPDDEQFRPFFDTVSELGMAVLSHCGWLAPAAGVSAAYYSHPGRFEKVIRTYTDTVFIMAHMGGIAGFLETVMLTTRTPNTYADCSPGQGAWVLAATGSIAASVPPDRVLWGADSWQQQQWLDHNADALCKLGFGPHFEKIFYSNARGILERIGAVEAEK